MKYLVDATLTIGLEEIRVNLDHTPSEEDDFKDALMDLIHNRLVYLDIKGGRTGDDGLLTSIVCDSIDNWEAS